MRIPPITSIAFGCILCLLGLPAVFANAADTIVCQVSPAVGPVEGGITITISGTAALNPPGDIQVYFGGVAATVLPGITVHPEERCPNAIQCQLPPHAEGSVDVIVITPSGTALLSAALTYAYRPQIFTVMPLAGSVHGGNRVYLRIDHLAPYYIAPGAKVYFGNTEVPEYELYGQYDMEVLTPPNAAGPATITVVNPDGLTGQAFFEYRDLSVTGISPAVDFGPYRHSVRIKGEGFSDRNMRVTFGGIDGEVNGVQVQSDNTSDLVCVTPAGILGTVDVVVYDGGGHTATMRSGYTFRPNSVTLDGTHLDGDVLGGDVVRIHPAYWLYTPVRVRFGNTEVDATVDSDPYGNFIRCLTPAHAPGTVDMTVIIDGSALTFPGVFTYVVRPANDHIENALPIGANETITDTNAAAEATPHGDCPDGCSCTTRDVFYKLRTFDSGTLSLTLRAAQVYNTVRVYDAQENLVACTVQAEPASATVADKSNVVLQPIHIDTCTPYYIAVARALFSESEYSSGASFELSTRFQPDGGNAGPAPNDEAIGAAELFYDTPLDIDLACATATGAPEDATRVDFDFWYFVHATERGRLSLSACAIPQSSEGLPTLTVYDNIMNELISTTPTQCGFPLDVELPAAGKYLIQVTRTDPQVNAFTLHAKFPNYPVEGEAEGGTKEGAHMEGEGVQEGLHPEGSSEGVAEGISEGTAEGVSEGTLVIEGEGEAPLPARHDADTNGDNRIDLSEVLRVIQLHNAGAYQCADETEDGFTLGAGVTFCRHHTADYAPADWNISLHEVLRVFQLYNFGGYTRCDGEDGYCAGQKR